MVLLKKPEGKLAVGGETRIEDSIIEAIAQTAALSVPGVIKLGRSQLGRLVSNLTGRTKTNLEIGAGVDAQALAVDLAMVVEYDFNLYEVAVNTRVAVATQILRITGLEVATVNIDVVDIHYSSGEKKLIEEPRVQ